MAVIVALVAVAVAAMPAAASRSDNGTLTVRGVNVDWVTFDFQNSNRNDNLPFIAAAYDRLLAYGPGFKLVPYLATSWKVSPAARPKIATFTIRHDAKCSDGTPVTPSVIAASFDHLFTGPKTVNLIPGNFGPGPFHVTANNKAWTFTLRTETPFRDLLSGFAWVGSSIVCPAGLKALASDPHALDAQMYGSGPYTLVSAQHASQIVMKLRPDWTWGPLGTTSKTLPGTLVYRYVPDETTAANLLIAGGLDVGWATGTDRARLKSTSSLIKKTAINYSIGAMDFNMFPGHPTMDERVREAVMTAFDPKAFDQIATGGTGILTPSFIAPGEPCFDPATFKLAPKPSLSKAAAILAADGYTLSGGKLMKDGKQLHLRVVGFNFVSPAGGEYVQHQLESLGIDVEVGASTAYGADAVQGNFDVGFIGGSAVAPLPTINIHIFSGPPPAKGGSNFSNTGGGDPELTRLANLAGQYNGPKGCAIFNQLQELYLKKHYLYGISAGTTLMVSRGWDFLPSQIFEVYSFKKTKA